MNNEFNAYALSSENDENAFMCVRIAENDLPAQIYLRSATDDEIIAFVAAEARRLAELKTRVFAAQSEAEDGGGDAAHDALRAEHLIRENTLPSLFVPVDNDDINEQIYALYEMVTSVKFLKRLRPTRFRAARLRL